MATSATPSLSMKLLIDGKAQRVLFAEASKEVVDFLFSLLAIPVATVVKLVGKEAMVGSVGNLYASVDKLDSTYMQAGAAKASLLSPTVLSPAASAANSSVLRLPSPSHGQQKTWYRCTRGSYSSCRNYITDTYGKACPRCDRSMKTATECVSSYGQPKTLYRCSEYCQSCREYITDAHGKACPACGRSMTTAMECLPSSSAGSGSSSSGQQVAAAQSEAKGFVQGIVTYTVTDNLTVTPMSAISSITLLNTFAVRDIGDLQEKTVPLGYNEGVAILKASLQSKSVLTDVFLPSGGGKKATPPAGHA